MRTFRFLVATAFAASILCPAQTTSAKSSAPKGTKPVLSSAKAGTSAPDAIFFDGVIYTGTGFAQDRPQIVEAIAIRGGKVIAIGKSAEITRLAGPKTALHDLNSATTST